MPDKESQFGFLKFSALLVKKVNGEVESARQLFRIFTHPGDREWTVFRHLSGMESVLDQLREEFVSNNGITNNGYRIKNAWNVTVSEKDCKKIKSGIVRSLNAGTISGESFLAAIDYSVATYRSAVRAGHECEYEISLAAIEFHQSEHCQDECV